MTLRGLITSSALGLAALTVLAEAFPSVAAPGTGTREARPAITAPPVAPPALASPPVPDGPAIRSVKVRPRSPVVGPRGGTRLVVEVVARGVAGPKGVTLRVEPGGRRARAHAAAPAPVPADASGWEVWRFDPPVRLTRWYPAGRWRAVATAKDASGRRATASASFLLRKATVLTGVRVARARKRGRAVRVAGTLMRVDPTGRFDYWFFPRQRLTLQFRRHGGRAWKSVARTRTNRDGQFARRVGRSHGTWRVVYAGTRHYAGVSRTVRHRAHK
ncbi:hypothetical protein [Sphaerisporangium perillae]|uniref:hypothetical protein n=1 Tax=Sphaerisporangium perillae TaxID=2935860 RepID=UPI00200CCC37|nr:hypothetical protein [Sphaerisporangium perillae]